MNILQLAGLLIIVNVLTIAGWALANGSSIKAAVSFATLGCGVGLVLTLGGRGYELKSPLGTLKAEAQQDVIDISLMKAAIKGHQDEIERQAVDAKKTAADLKDLERKAGETFEAVQKQLGLAKSKVTELSEIAEYWEVAQLDPLGLPFRVGSGISFQTPLSRMMEGTVRITNDKIYMTWSEEVKTKYELVILTFPKFPFAYYGMALGMRTAGDPGWVGMARRAISVLEKTTRVPSHNTTHDQVLSELKGYLREAEGPAKP